MISPNKINGKVYTVEEVSHRRACQAVAAAFCLKVIKIALPNA